MNKLLELKNVSLAYHTKTDEIVAVKSLSFNCHEGEFVSIIGPSGCGKTTILSMIAGLILPTGGKIIVDGQNANESNDIGYMLQKDHLFPWRTIEKNLYLPLEIKGKNDKESRDYALVLLEKYGLTNFKSNFPDQLSGGMRQRVALIRTLVSKPKLLLLDEPFSALDYQTRLSVCDDVYSIIKTEQKTTVLVTHDISEAISMSDKIIVLTDRPAQVKTIFKPMLDGNTPLRKRESKDFGLWFEKIWSELNK
jgi:NitT/TauT family transport system ATP-binding protein